MAGAVLAGDRRAMKEPGRAGLFRCHCRATR
jgi:hypothetical protein